MTLPLVSPVNRNSSLPEFTFEPSPWGHSYAITLSEWAELGYIDPISEKPIQQIHVETVTGQFIPLHTANPLTDPSQSIALAPRKGPDKEVHFWYGKTPSGTFIKVFPSA
jgi:hypothetical protein